MRWRPLVALTRSWPLTSACFNSLWLSAVFHHFWVASKHLLYAIVLSRRPDLNLLLSDHLLPWSPDLLFLDS